MLRRHAPTEDDRHDQKGKQQVAQDGHLLLYRRRKTATEAATTAKG